MANKLPVVQKEERIAGFKERALTRERCLPA